MGQKRIIVEGPDGAGKTVLIHYLMDHFHCLVLAEKLGPSDDIQARHAKVLRAEPPPGMVFIHDRFFFSELVYGPLLRGKCEFSNEFFHATLDELQDSALVIYCRPEWATLEREVHVEKQMDGVKENFYTIIDEYDDIMQIQLNQFPEGHLHYYDWTKRGALSRIERAVEEFLY